MIKIDTMHKPEYIDRAAVLRQVCTNCPMLVDGICRDADPCGDLIAGFLSAPVVAVKEDRKIE